MARKGVPGDIAATVLDRFEEVGLIDDAVFAGLWVQSQQRRMTSARAMRGELQAKGVDAAIIAEVMPDADADYEAALALARKKIRTMGGLEPHVRYRRLAGALARKGFAPGLIHRVVAEVTGAASEVDGEDG